MKGRKESHFTYEKRNAQLLSHAQFMQRMMYHGVFAFLLLLLALLIGVLGYHYLEDLDWIDAILNASMILGGMGPVDILKTEAGKLFASVYAIFSGAWFLVVTSILLAPAVHRFLHRFHINED